MADNARKLTDKKLTRIERKITLIYQQAKKEIEVTWNDYMKNLNNELLDKQTVLEKAKKSGDSKAIKKAQKSLQDAIFLGTIQNKKYKSMIEKVVENLAHVNQIALSYINGELPSICVENYNGINQSIANIAKMYDFKYSFTIINEETVRQLTLLDKTLMLPEKKMNIAKDKRWNIKKINNSVLQGILQGEDIPTIASRIQKITNSNRKAAIINARTMITAAENRGRLAAQERAEQNGVVLEKEWLATADNRTRESHLKIDGETRKTNERFSNGLLYPGDYGGKPHEVYGCRCTMTTKIIGFRKTNGRIDYVKRNDITDLHDRQIKTEQQRRKEEVI